ncbi:L-ribulose-5-phosphate 3-epimerase [Anaerorhabdus sp.]|jgi:L-ribulose-5-phosphate 3-epimerase|uniref:L-ribulose-5-phosphate 3-epimerase n=1 Tax=Anaerorhabdus sp. TaxID=1872524 RepID=UPI002FCA9919
MDNKKYLLGLYEKSMPVTCSWEEKLLNCKKFGFDWLEISIDETDSKLARLDWGKEEINELKMLMMKTGVPIKTMCLSGHRKYPLGSLDEETITKSLKIMEKAIYLAKELGIRIIQLAGYDVYYTEGNEETKKTFITNLKKSVEMAAKEGVVLGFETMETSFMDTVKKSMEFIDIVNNPYLQIYPDMGNLTNASLLYGHDLVNDIQSGMGHIVAAHLKETIPGHYREIPFGTGHTDFNKVITCCKELGVRMFVGEFWYVGQADWEKDCIQASVFLREKLDRVFND